jgi:hypothetical protein
MRTGSFIAGTVILLILFAACSKKDQVSSPPLPQPVPVEEVRVADLNNQVVNASNPSVAVDLSADGRPDVFFGIMLVGDPIYKVDKTRFIVVTNIFTALPVSSQEQVLPFLKGQNIPLNEFGEHVWYNAVEIELFKKTEQVSGQISWDGNWLGANKWYLPVQIWQNGGRYNAWIELSVDQANAKMTIHRSGVSVKPEKPVVAGVN